MKCDDSACRCHRADWTEAETEHVERQIFALAQLRRSKLPPLSLFFLVGTQYVAIVAPTERS